MQINMLDKLTYPIQNLKKSTHETLFLRISNGLDTLVEEPTLGMHFTNMNNRHIQTRFEQISKCHQQIRTNLQARNDNIESLIQVQPVSTALKWSKEILKDLQRSAIAINKRVKNNELTSKKEEQVDQIFIDTFFTANQTDQTYTTTATSTSTSNNAFQKVRNMDNPDEIVRVLNEPLKFNITHVPSFLPIRKRYIPKTLKDKSNNDEIIHQQDVEQSSILQTPIQESNQLESIQKQETDLINSQIVIQAQEIDSKSDNQFHDEDQQLKQEESHIYIENDEQAKNKEVEQQNNGNDASEQNTINMNKQRIIDEDELSLDKEIDILYPKKKKNNIENEREDQNNYKESSPENYETNKNGQFSPKGQNHQSVVKQTFHESQKSTLQKDSDNMKILHRSVSRTGKPKKRLLQQYLRSKDDSMSLSAREQMKLSKEEQPVVVTFIRPWKATQPNPPHTQLHLQLDHPLSDQPTDTGIPGKYLIKELNEEERQIKYRLIRLGQSIITPAAPPPISSAQDSETSNSDHRSSTHQTTIQKTRSMVLFPNLNPFFKK